MKVEFIGNIGHNAEKKQAQDGRDFLTFSVADTVKQGGQELTTWIDCISNNVKLAQWLTKGTKVFVRGRLSTKIWQKKDGSSAIQYTCNVSELEFCGGGKTEQQGIDAQNEDKPF